jgi:hypothetical protein
MYQGMHSYKGLFTVDADTESMARKVVSRLIEAESPEIPDNWDDIKFIEEGTEVIHEDY